MTTDLLFTLKIKSVGWEEDEVTPIRKIYAGIELLHSWTEREKYKLGKLFDQANIVHTFVPKTPERDGHMSLDITKMFQAVSLVESQKDDWKVKDIVPLFVVDHVIRHQNTPFSITYDQIRDKLGKDLWSKIRPFQKTGIYHGVNNKREYLGDEMGSGKTLQAIGICKYYEDRWPMLIVCPSILRNTWKRELMKWIGVPEENIFVVESAKEVSDNDNHQVMIISYALISKPEVTKCLEKNYDVVVLDECQYIKTRSSKRTKAAVDIASNASICCLLSGTPCSYPVELYSQIKALYPKIYPWFFNSSGVPGAGEYFYASRYCDPQQVEVKRGLVQWTYKGYQNHEELNAVLSTFMIRRRKEVILPFLPDKNRTCIVLDPLKTKEYWEIAQLLKKEKETTIDELEQKKSEGGTKKALKKSNPDKYMKSFRLTCKYKIPKVLDFLRQYMIGDFMKENPDTKILIFSHHTLMRKEIEECLEKHRISFFSIYGGVSDKKRAEFEHDFQNTDRYRVGVLSIHAACTGLTLTKASVVIFTELLFGPDIMFQAEDRVHRIGQKSDVNIFYLIEPKTTDDINWNLIVRKERESTTILDGKSNYVTSRRVNPSVEDPANSSASLIVNPSKRCHPSESKKPFQPPAAKRRMITKRMADQRINNN
jgi:SWI/SNF-related matrix-associated actin-dependent regulator 1 of chromatin subfamily A